MAKALQTALDPVLKSGDGGSAHRSALGASAAPTPGAHKWPGGRGSALEQAVPLRNARMFPLPFTGTQIADRAGHAGPGLRPHHRGGHGTLIPTTVINTYAIP